MESLLASIMSSSAPLSRAGLIGGAVCAAWGGSMALWMGRAALRRGRERRRFNEAALERGFSADEARTLWRLGRHDASGDPQGILQSRDAFDECVRAALATCDDSAGVPEELLESKVTALRRKFGTVRRAPRHLASTRDVEPNQPVRVSLNDGTEFNAFILDTGSDGIHLTLPAGPNGHTPSLERVRSVRVTFWRPQDARYEFETRVAKEERDLHALALEHTDMLRRQERQFVRVRCHDMVRMAPMEEKAVLAAARRNIMPEDAQDIMLHDISCGGASFFCNTELPRGCWLLVQVPLRRQPGRILQPAQVVRQSVLSGTAERRYLTSIRFDPLTPRNEHHLGRFVADIQQRLIRRLLARAGEQEESIEALRAEVESADVNGVMPEDVSGERSPYDAVWEGVPRRPVAESAP